MYTDSKLLIR